MAPLWCPTRVAFFFNCIMVELPSLITDNEISSHQLSLLEEGEDSFKLDPKYFDSIIIIIIMIIMIIMIIII